MKPNNQLKEYVRVIKSVDVDETVQERIIKYCAGYGTLSKIRSGKYKLIAVKKENFFEKN